MMMKEMIGDCDCCPDSIGVRLTQVHDMWMCDSCLTRNETAAKILNDSHVIDSQIELKADIFNAATVSFIELQAAISNNSTIADDRKNYELVKEAELRLKAMDAVIFADETALMEKKQARHAWLVNAQIQAGKLHESQRAHFKSLNISYQPATPKSKKPAKDKTPKTGKSFDKQAIMDASKKYGVPMAGVQSLIVSKHGMSPDAAARQLAVLMGLIEA
jgi:hypothetical protein